MRERSRLVLSTVFAALLLVGCASKPSDPRLPLGVNVGWVVQGPPALVSMTPTEAALVHSTGAGLARVEFRTTPFFNQTSAAFYEDYGQVIANLAAQHVQVLGLIDYTTVPGGQSAWTVNGATGRLTSGANAYTEQFATTAAAIMKHFQGQVQYWEIWNEPNASTQENDGVDTGGTFMYPNNYAALLQETYHQAVAVDHLNVVIVSAGLLGGAYGGVYSAANSGANYLQSVFECWQAQKVSPYPLDAVGQHLYIAQGGVAGSLVTQSQVQEYLNWVHEVPIAFGMKNVPTFLTEVGWNSHQVGSSDKAENLATALGVAEKTPYVHALVWYNLQSAGTADYGLFRSNGTPSLALANYKKIAASWGS